jgi:hypothetical protein
MRCCRVAELLFGPEARGGKGAVTIPQIDGTRSNPDVIVVWTVVFVTRDRGERKY